MTARHGSEGSQRDPQRDPESGLGNETRPVSDAVPPDPAEGELLLIRHAESEWNALGLWQGHADPPLSRRGREQAAALAERVARELAECRVDILVCSDLQRAHETARAVGAVLGLEPRPDARYRELDVGCWSGLCRAEIEQRDADLLARFEAAHDLDVRPGGGESRREIRIRARDSVEDLLARHEGARVALVSHLGFLRALVPGVEPQNAELIRIGIREVRLRASRGVDASEPDRLRL